MAAVRAVEEVVKRRTLSATFIAKHRGFGHHLGGGDHCKGLPRLSHVRLVVSRRPVAAEGA